jgi:hypothetical protein
MLTVQAKVSSSSVFAKTSPLPLFTSSFFFCKAYRSFRCLTLPAFCPVTRLNYIFYRFIRSAGALFLSYTTLLLSENIRVLALIVNMKATFFAASAALLGSVAASHAGFHNRRGLMGTGVMYEEVCSTYTSTWCGEATRKFLTFINTAR